jgi:hypothetical protein
LVNNNKRLYWFRFLQKNKTLIKGTVDKNVKIYKTIKKDFLCSLYGTGKPTKKLKGILTLGIPYGLWFMA